MRKLLAVLLGASLLAALLYPLLTKSASAVPIPVMVVTGTVTVNGQTAPAGLTISAEIGGTTFVTTSTAADGSYGVSAPFNVPGDDPDTTAKEGGTDGETVVIRVEEIQAATTTFAQGVTKTINLSVTDTTAPPAPTGLTQTTPVTDNTPTFTWTAQPDVSPGLRISFFEVRISTETGQDTFVNIGNVTTHTFTTLVSDNTNHTFQARAVDKAGNVGAIASLSFSIQTVGVVANFTADVTKGVAPLSVQFTDQSTGDINSYAWDFDTATDSDGDGTADNDTDSTAQNPSHSYATGGDFTVKLTVQGPGGTDTTTKAAFIRTIKSDFTGNPTTGTVSPGNPLTVSFTSQAQGTVDTFAWDFNGDGVTDSGQQNPSFQYPSGGSFTVALKVTGPAGTDTKTKAGFIKVFEQPVAEFKADVASGTAPLTVKFTDLSTGNPDTWAWDFDNDGTPDSTLQNPTHTFNTGGDFTVKLTVSNAGGSDSETKANFIRTIKSDFTASPTTGTVSPGNPLTVTFTNKTTGTANAVVWDFDGDGHPDVVDLTPNFDETVQFTFSTGGVFSPSLRASGPAGISTEIKANLLNILQLPDADFIADVTTGPAPLTVQFTDLSTQNPTSWAWDFGTQVDTDNDGVADSQTSALQNPKVAYLSGGDFTVKLTATNTGGSSAPETKAAFIRTIKSDFTVSSAGDTDGGPGLTDTAPVTVTFTNQSTGTASILFWDFDGDGAPDTVDLTPTFGETTQFTFSRGGIFSPSLRASGPAGNSSETKANLLNILQLPDADFIADVTRGPVPLTVQFTDLSTQNPTSWAWDFGTQVDTDNDGTADSQTSTLQNPKVTYLTGGDFTVKLTATNTAGPNTETKAAFVRTIDADFTVSSAGDSDPGVGLTDTAPVTVTFTNQSTGTANAIAWDFDGDGHPDAVDLTPNFNETIQFTFNNGGVFSPSIRASGPAGISTVAKANLLNILQLPDADFSADVTRGPTDLTVQFTDQSTRNPNQWAWDFDTATDSDGDGTADNDTDSTAQNPSHTYNTGGDFTVKLTATNTAGPDTETKAAFIRTIKSDFAVDLNIGSTPLTVTFTNKTTGTANALLWDFDGDGHPDAVDLTPNFNETVQHTFTTGGVYSPSLRASGPAGISTETKANALTVLQTPTAQFTATKRGGGAPFTTQFIDLSTGNPTAWEWDFDTATDSDGDGIADNDADSTAQNPSHTYNTGGNFAVKLTVFNAAAPPPTGVSTTKASFIKTVNADFSANPTTGAVSQGNPLTVNFTDQSTGSIFLRLWDFNNDGRFDSVAQNPSFDYKVGGLYTVRLLVIGSAGIDQEIKTGFIDVAQAPTAQFQANIKRGKAPLTVNFFNFSFGNPTSYLWDFGDGATSTDKNPSHTYNTGGDFTVKLTVTNSAGSDVRTRTNFIRTIDANFTANPTSGLEPLAVQFTDTTQGTVNQRWWFLNGRLFSRAQNPSAILRAGDWTVTLWVFGPGAFDIETKAAFIQVRTAPVADFTASGRIGPLPRTVTFRNLSRGNPTSFLWDFGTQVDTNNDGVADSQTSALQTPTVSYLSGGDFTVKLTATNSVGSNTRTRTNFVRLLEADFTANITSGNAPFTVTFFDQSTGTVLGRFWDLDPARPGIESTAKNPTYVYTTPGNKTIRLWVIGPFGFASEQKVAFIQVK